MKPGGIVTNPSAAGSNNLTIIRELHDGWRIISEWLIECAIKIHKDHNKLRQQPLLPPSQRLRLTVAQKTGQRLGDMLLTVVDQI
ncbi:MAG: hypothetical protein RR903_15710, partial [Edwardsiella sp. (in: enterobacteria)]